MSKLDISKIINKIKSEVEEGKIIGKIKNSSKVPFNPAIKHNPNSPNSPKIRNMMQEAIDMGSHNAKEYFKDTNK